MIINDLSKDLEISTRVKETSYLADGSMEERKLNIVNEHYMELYVNETLAARLVCSPSNLPEMVVGRLITEQFITSCDDVESIYICEYGSKAKVYLKEQISLSETVAVEPTCCSGNQIFLKNNHAENIPPLPYHDFDLDAVFVMAGEFANGSQIHKATKGAHCCYLWHKDRVIYAVEDIGRHNALDKAIGYLYINQLDPADCMAFTTGRVPTDMVKKVVAARIPTLISKAVPTDQSLMMADYFNLNLICRAWPDKVSVMVRSKEKEQK